MNDELKAMPERIAEFLRMALPGGPYVVGAIRVEGGAPKVKTFEDADEAAAWATTMNGGRAHNLYWIHNRLKDRVTEKPKEEDVLEVLFLHVDCDPPKKLPRAGMAPEELARWNAAERERLLDQLVGFDPEPTFIVDSGGGFQSFWRLDEPLFIGGDPTRIAEAKAYNVHLRDVLGGDNCQSLEHLMRLPFTANWPDAEKRKRGRTARLAELVSASGQAYPLAEFTPAAADTKVAGKRKKGAVAVERGEVRRISDPAEELKPWNVPPWVPAVIIHGHNPEEPDRWDGDRSRAVFAVCCELHRREVPAELIVGIITDKSWDISAHVLDQRRPVDYAWSQVEKARAAVAEGEDAFQTDKDGKPYANQFNIRLALSKMGVTVRHDTFADRLLIEGLEGRGPELNDPAMIRLRLTIQERFRFLPGKDFFHDVVEDLARQAPFHPVCQYLDSLQWDGVPRLDGWLSRYGGAPNTEFTRAAGSLVFVAAVRRVRQPGVKFDEMLVLESKQGTNKSSALRLLAVRDEWFIDDLPLNAESKVVIERLNGRWIAEAAELKGSRKAEVEHLKAFLSRQWDTARMSYARLSETRPRQCVIIGTTNSARYLRDASGNRRFWPVAVEGFDLAALRRDRDQLWAEAAVRDAEGLPIQLDPALWEAAAIEQDARRVEDPFVVTLDTVLGERTGRIRTVDLWRLLDVKPGQQTQEHNARLGDAMQELGWEKARLRFGGPLEYCYVRGSEEERKATLRVRSSPEGAYISDEDDGTPY